MTDENSLSSFIVTFSTKPNSIHQSASSVGGTPSSAAAAAAACSAICANIAALAASPFSRNALMDSSFAAGMGRPVRSLSCVRSILNGLQ